jgi:alpha-beta hydrolase superfamily lysophospholipase
MNRWMPVLVLGAIIGIACAAGCLGAAPAAPPSSSSSPSSSSPVYALADDGALVITGTEPVYDEYPADRPGEDGNVTVSTMVFHVEDVDVHALCAAPADPVAGVVLVPGAGVIKEGHRGRIISYAQKGIATIVLDVRGNGGETAGHTGGLQEDYLRFVAGEAPQWWQTIGDIVTARRMMTERYAVPVYIVGSSNGGMQGAVAAAVDPGAAGYVGVSTAGFEDAGAATDPSVAAFLRSIDPDAYIGGIAPRPVWLFHSMADSIISYAAGEALFEAAGEPKTFTEFTGGHGITGEVDTAVTGAILTLNTP